MSARMPPRRIGQCAFAALKPTPTYWSSTAPVPLRSRRSLATTPHRCAPSQERDNTPKAKGTEVSNPVLEKYLEQQAREKAASKRPARPIVKPGGLSADPPAVLAKIIDRPRVRPPKNLTAEARKRWRAEQREEEHRAEDFKLHALKLDPDPIGRKKWERKMVITSLRKRGRLTKAMKLKREERESRYKSQFLPTSIKKLTKVMNQIAGKTVEEALVQLQFSKKKVARDVFKGLTVARDEAIVARGMGLGIHKTEEELLEEEGDAPKVVDISSKDTSSDTYRPPKQSRPATIIELKDGKSKRVTDPTQLYVDQAWVGRGTPSHSPEFRARGKVNLLTHRLTSFSVLLKEERTRIRISEEIKKKRASRKVWVPLPDRPVTAQRQYCLW
ncbi:ribosomal protein L22 [Pleomassaria siparia CBS 279.74]|uniref:Ribosomal protein L22 n=1 Tax=Pleomassaria siparia CBS 279.74 TaxID=1314801 RepID=A0A6G1JRM3_9PLEO|nr:ribosomal protein L22 [Pleomassaria siparia CBS 279.74]